MHDRIGKVVTENEELPHFNNYMNLDPILHPLDAEFDPLLGTIPTTETGSVDYFESQSHPVDYGLIVYSLLIEQRNEVHEGTYFP